MLKKRRIISSKGYSGSESKEKSLRSDNLRTSLSVSSLFSQTISRPKVPKKEKSINLQKKSLLLPVNGKRPKAFSPSVGIPEDVAVHFGNFYCLGNKSTKNGTLGRNEEKNKSELPVRGSPRSEFTRQMVHKLERLAGTEYYARQISALLEDTVESPNFAVKQPPNDNFVPYERSDPLAYPLWYKEPDKMNYRSPTKSSMSIDAKKETVKTAEKPLESETRNCTLTSSRSLIESRQTFNITDSEDSDESSSISSEITSIISDENIEDESDVVYEEVKIAIVVK